MNIAFPLHFDSRGRTALAEDDEDLKAFQSRAQERNLDFNKVVLSLRRRAKL